MSEWGMLPEEVRQRLRALEWDRSSNLRERLLGTRTFPIRIGLKPPTGREAVEALGHFQAYMAAWRKWPGPGRVEYESRKLPQVDRHDLPLALVLEDFDTLIAFLGAEAEIRRQHWESVFEPLRLLSPTLRPALIRNLAFLESGTVDDSRRLALVLRQLQQGMGRDCYLRALPLTGVDTKFVEQNWAILTELSDQLHDGAVRRAGGLEAWLGCLEPPRSWLTVRVLCSHLRSRLGGLDLLQLTTETLFRSPLPGRRVLIVENNASGYALPEMKDTVAVIGGGANIRWTQAAWLADRQLGYWGDIDTWGLHYLCGVRRNQPQVQSLMMDQATLLQHLSRIVHVADPNPAIPEGLNADEIELYCDLLERRHGGTCIEQEQLDADWIRAALERWTE